MSNSVNRHLNLQVLLDCNHPCDIDQFIWFPTLNLGGNSASLQGKSSASVEEVGQNLIQNKPSTRQKERP